MQERLVENPTAEIRIQGRCLVIFVSASRTAHFGQPYALEFMSLTMTNIICLRGGPEGQVRQWVLDVQMETRGVGSVVGAFPCNRNIRCKRNFQKYSSERKCMM